MKMWEKTKWRPFWTTFLPALVFIMLALTAQFYFSSTNLPKNITKSVTVELEAKALLLKYYIEKISDLSPLTENEENSLEDAGLSVFVYEDDVLKYWSTNLVLIPDILQAETNQSYPKLLKTMNGWYIVYRYGNFERLVEGRILLKNNFPFENEFLQNKFQKSFKVPEGTEILSEHHNNAVYSSTGKFLFSLKIPDDPPLSRMETIVLLFIYLIALVLLLVSIYKLLISLPLIISRFNFFILFVLCLLSIRFIHVYFRIPNALYDSDIFGPQSFSSSFFFGSLGDFLINSICLLVMAYVFYVSFSLKSKKPESILLRGLYLFMVIAFLILEVVVAIYLLKDLVVNSTIPFNLQDVSDLNFYSFIGFIIIGAVFLSLFLFGVRFTGWMIDLTRARNRKLFKGITIRKYSITNMLIYLAFSSVFATITLNHYNEQIERDKRKLLALKLSAERDPLAETLFSRFEEKFTSDSLLKQLLTRKMSSDTIIRYMQQNFFRDYWNNYSIQITTCTDQKILRVQPQNYLVDCDTYFQTLIKEISNPTYSKNFYFLDYGHGFKNYLAIINYKGVSSDSLKAYVEFNSKLIFQELGYPELLVDKRQVQIPDLSGYSYAYYKNDRLMNRVGPQLYSTVIKNLPHLHKEYPHFYLENNISHYCFPIDANSFLIISKPENSRLDKISPFSYLFLFFAIFTITFYVIIKFPAVFSSSWFGLGSRLQLAMSLILITSFIIIGLLMLYYITRLNEQKNQENLRERGHSMLVELQHKMGTTDSIGDSNKATLGELLTKFSNVFFSDINMYDTTGSLLAASRPEIFEAGLVSRKMNIKVFSKMRDNNYSYYLMIEKIGEHSYNSAYLPFYNENNKLLAYLNLPYFTREEELKREISSFLIAFINIYVFLIITGLVISLIVSKYITRPLRLLTANIGRLGYGRKNEKLEWSRNDEVGKLVDEYNRMVNELEKSAGLLARSERESAWREMARQVAHEIKNPLTPMKLSVQHLQKAWKDNAPDWEIRLHRFTATMTEQIETLASIASEFSDFAKMPVKKEELIDIHELIDKSLDLYHDIASIKFVFNKADKIQWINADRKQINRVLTNLINNAVYAIGERPEGMIIISISGENDSVLINISDNGSGISREQAEHIFQPNFTTKSSGMGLGLAIVKSIIQGTGGEIHFHSEEGKGTTFMLRFPITSNNTITNRLPSE